MKHFFQYLHSTKFYNGKCGNVQEWISDTYNAALYSSGDLIFVWLFCKHFPQYLYTMNE